MGDIVTSRLSGCPRIRGAGWQAALDDPTRAALAARLALQHLTGGFITGATTLAAISSPLGDRSNPWWWYVLAPITVLLAAAGSISVVADETVPGALLLTALFAVGALLLSRDRERRAART